MVFFSSVWHKAPWTELSGGPAPVPALSLLGQVQPAGLDVEGLQGHRAQESSTHLAVRYVCLSVSVSLFQDVLTLVLMLVLVTSADTSAADGDVFCVHKNK